MKGVCPRCGALRVASYRYCPACSYDFGDRQETPATATSGPAAQSFMERFRGTPWETQPVATAEPQPTFGQTLKPFIVLWLALLATFIGALLAKDAGVFDMVLGPELMFFAALSISLIAGQLSKVVPGTIARGPFKGWIVGWFGTGVGALIVIPLFQWVPPVVPITVADIIDRYILATLGAIVLRWILWFFE